MEIVTRHKRLSKAARFARANKGLVYEVTDPELRSQLWFYRKQQLSKRY